VFKKLSTKFLRPLGMFFIFLFAVCCIFGSIFVRDIDSSTILGKFLDYTVSFENRFYDYRMRESMDRTFLSKDVALVKIDDYSLQKIGSWPLPRTVHAQMLDKIRTFGGKVVAMDVMFPEKSPALKDLSPDSILAQAIKDFQTEGRRVFLAYTLAGEGEEVLAEPPLEMLNDAIQTRNFPEIDFSAKKIARYTFPIQELVETEVGLGSINNAEDTDGVFRQYQLASNVDTIYYGSLSLNAVEAFTAEKNTITISRDGTGELSLGERKMEISRDGETKVRFIGGEGNFPEIALYDLISAPDDDPKMRAQVENKILFVGSTALGAHDLRPSPVDSKMPGVFSHMNMAHMLLHRYFFQNANESLKYSLLFLLIAMVVFLVVQRFQNALLDILSVLGILLGAYYFDKNYFMPQGYELKLFYCFFCILACYSWNTFLAFYEANKEKKQIRGTFARYVAPTVVDEMLKDPDKLQVGGTKMDITCLFSDVRDFTSISEGLSATELAHSLNLYMGKMTDIVFDSKGTLDKYIGDAIVALWGAPLPIGNHAQFAVEGAIKMMETLPAINAEFRKLNRPEFNIGIGLNSGECSVGNMGSDRIFSYTALGDNMNLGARLESLCKHYGAQILISEYTLERIQNITTRSVDKVIVKGKTHPVQIYEVIHGEHFMHQMPQALGFFQDAYKAFMSRDFLLAQELWEKVLLLNDHDKVTLRYLTLTRKFLADPTLAGENFDTTKMTEK
jgi:adenylate cyclase